MYTRPAAPRSIGGVLDDAIRLYQASFSRCWVLSLIGAALTGALGLYATLHLGVLTSPASKSMAGAVTAMARIQRMEHSPRVWGSYLLVSLVWFVFRAAIIARQDAVAARRSDSNGQAAAYALRRLPRIIVAGIVFGVVITVGMIIFVVPGIWLWGCLQLWLVALCVEDLGPFASFGRSWRLIEGNWWRTSATVGVAIVLILVLSLAESVLIGVVTAAGRPDPAVLLMTSQIVGVALSVFTMPMLTAAMLAIFYDLKLRREGGDLAARVSSLQPA
ncbi:MAG: hypothetical protein ACRETK_05550 [Steroidobacteraceae bacterium]